MSSDLLSEIVPGYVWAIERSVWFGGVRLRARTTVVRLEGGRLLVHSPAPPSAELREQLHALGDVSWLVVPNCFHHLGTPAAAAAFGSARVVGPRSAAARNRQLRIDVDIAGPELAAAAPELLLLPLAGVPFLDETLLYHRPTETLLGADVVLWADECDHWTWRTAARLTGCFKRVSVPPDVKKSALDRPAVHASLQALRDLPIQRLVVAHGAVIDHEPLDRLLEAWRAIGVG